MATITVEGTLHTPNGAPIVGASIKFVSNKFSKVPTGSAVELITDGSGQYSAAILYGSYHVFYKHPNTDLYKHVRNIVLAENMAGLDEFGKISLEGVIGTFLELPQYEGCEAIPTPVAFTVTGGFTNIFLEWTILEYTCHSVTEIWYADTDDFNSKIFLDTTEASIYADAPGNAATRYYWIRFRNKNLDVGDWYSTSGVLGQTAINPAQALADIQQDVYNSQIFADLRTNINSTFYQSTEPTTKPNGEALISGDIWIDSNNNQRYVWDISQEPAAWLATTDKEVLDVLTDLAHTAEVADGEIKGFFQSSEPLPVQSAFGDIWIDTAQTPPLTSTAIFRYQDENGESTGTLAWRSAPNSALGQTYVESYNTNGELQTLNATYNQFITSILPVDLEQIQSQVDGSITTWFETGVPTLANYPANAWDATNAGPDPLLYYNNHLGDLYYDYNTEYAYRFAYEDLPDDDPDAGLIYSWIQVSDVSMTAALANAAAAQDTADSKRRVFVSTPVPPYDVGDLWTHTDESIYVCSTARTYAEIYNANDWTKATNFIRTFYSDELSVPSNPNPGDLWVVTDLSDELRRYSGSAWITIQLATLANVDTKIIEQVGYCENTDGTHASAYTNKTTCEAAGKTWNPTGALASTLDTVNTTVGTNTATVAVHTESLNGIQAKYAVRLNTDGNVSGFGLSAGAGCLVTDSYGNSVINPSITTEGGCTSAGGTWVPDSSTFLVAADNFAVTGTDENPITPFVVTTTTTTVNGETVPAGVYIDAAHIKNGTITNAKIGDAAIDTAKIGDAAITNAKIGNAAVTNAKIDSLDASKITTGTLAAGRIAANSITADKINTTSLSALSADLGTVTAGKLESTDGKMIVDLDNKTISIET